MNKVWSVAFLLSCLVLNLKAYYQQEVKYDIKVFLDDQEHTLHAFEEVIYINNSPDTLNEIYMHLWPKAYQANTALDKQLVEDRNMLLYFGDQAYKGFIDSLDFKVDGKKVISLESEHKDLTHFKLNAGLLPGDSIVITTPFRVKIPYGEVSRLGYLDGSYQITQWYPKPAVYDGEWHAMPYLTQGEFFSEFGSFKVAVSVPEKHVIAATGNLISKSNHNGIKTEVYSLDKIHDFAWFTDTNWIETESEVTLPNSGRKVKTYSKYNPENAYIWDGSEKYIDSALYYYSLWIGDYPYDVCTALDGGLTAGAGMEYPTITVLGGQVNRKELEEVVLHEIGHNWFYGVLGTNERVNPWMDEGINSYYERRFYEEVRSDLRIGDFFPIIRKVVKDLTPKQTEFHHMNHDLVNTRNLDLPINLPSNEYSSINYGAIVYSKAAISFNYLEKYLGKKLFDQCMQKYFDVWKFKHPSPVDLRKIFVDETGMELKWFFDDLLQTSYPVDYKVHFAGYSFDNKSFDVVVANVGDIASPIVISALRNGKVVKTAWYEGFFGTKSLSFPKGDYDEVAIDYYHDMPELNRKNNRYILFSLFGRVEPLEATFFFNFEKDDKTQIFFLPIAGVNYHDNFQLGMAAYNSLIKEKKFRFLVMPQFSFGTQKLVGFGQAVYSFYPAEYFQKVNVNLSVRRQGLGFGGAIGKIQKIEASTNFILQRPNDRSKIRSSFEAKLSNVSVEFDRRGSKLKNYITFDYNIENKRAINPFDFNSQLQAFDQNWKLQGEFNYSLTVNNRLQSIDIRGFGGLFLQSVDVGTERFRVTAGNGTLLGTPDLEQFIYHTHDYLFDQAFLGRFMTDANLLSSQQVYSNDGGFKSGVTPGLASSWLGGLNVVIPLPVKFLSFYTDFAIYDRIWDDFKTGGISAPLLYDYGLQLNLKKDYLEIYFPLGFSESIQSNYDVNGVDSYMNKIKFMFNINEIYTILQ